MPAASPPVVRAVSCRQPLVRMRACVYACLRAWSRVCVQGKAEVLALAKRMLRRKEKESIIDAAYNRYAYHDNPMPRWFSEDERRHMR